MTREIIDFSSELGRHGTLLGREEVVAELDKLLLGRNALTRGWVLIKGGPGTGKSALLVHYLRRMEARGLRVPHHFLRRGVEDWDRPEAVSRNLAAQIEALYPAQASLEVRQESRLREVLQRVSDDVLVPTRTQLVLVVDGLNEVQADESGRNPLPSFLPHVLPPGVQVLCASRPIYPHLAWLEAREGVRCIDLDDERWAASNQEVVRQYWELTAPLFQPQLGPDFIAEATRQAQGNILYTVKLLDWLLEQPLERRRAELLPRGLEAFLVEIWQRLLALPDHERTVVLSGLGLISAAREALPLPVLAHLAGWQDTETEERFLRATRPFLMEEPARWGGERAWRPFHESFREFIVRSLGVEEMRRVHRHMAAYLGAWPVNQDFRRHYALRHGVTHWFEARDWEGVRTLCTDLSYLENKCREVGVFVLEEDLRRAADVSSGDVQTILRALHRSVRAESHWLQRDPGALSLLVYNRLRALGWTETQLGGTLRFRECFPALRLQHPVRMGGGEIRTLTGHESAVRACALTSDGRYLVSVSDDKRLKVWEVETGRELASLEGHEGGVLACAVTPDGRRVVSASADRMLKVWDLETGQELATLQGHEGWVFACAVTSDGRRMMSASADKTLKLWDLETRQELATLRGHQDWVFACAMTRDGRRVVSASSDKTVRVWDVDTGQELATLRGHQDWVSACAMTPDGRRVVSASYDKTLKVWDVETGWELATLQGHEGWVKDCAVTPNGRRVVSASYDKTLKVWDVETGRELATLQGHEGWVLACAVTPDGRRMVSGSEDSTLKAWELDKSRELTTLRGHTKEVLACSLTADGRRMASASQDELKVWDLETGRVLTTRRGHEGVVSGCAVTADGRLMVSASQDELKVWDLERGRELTTLRGHEATVRACAVTADGRRVVSASSDGTLKVWDVETGRELATLWGHEGVASGCAITADGRRVVSASHDGTLKVWDVETGRELATLRGHKEWVLACAMSADGRRVVSASLDGTLKVWDVETGRQLATLRGHSHWVNACAMSADGRRVVSASLDGTLKVWEVETAEELVSLLGHEGGVFACAMTADGRRIVSASEDRTLKVWELETSQEQTSVQRHNASVKACAVTPDGRLLVSASDDRTLKVWDVEVGRELASLRGHEGAVNACAVTPDGRLLVSASDDKTLKVWDVEVDRELLSLSGHEGVVKACAVTPDGRLLVSASSDGILKAWALKTGRVLATWLGHEGGVTACAVTPDGRRVVSASLDGTLKVWDLETGLKLLSLEDQEGGVTACAVTPDGRRVVSASMGGTLKVWELETGRMLRALDGHQDSVNACGVTLDGQWIVSASSDKTIKVWELTSGRCLHTLYGSSTFSSVTAAQDTICAGDENGNVWFLHARASARHSQRVAARERADLGIVIALKEELREFLQLLPAGFHPEHTAETGEYVYLFDYPGTGHRCVLTFIGEMGPGPAALRAERLIQRWDIQALVMLGIAGGIHPDTKIGDVVVASQVQDYLVSTRHQPGGAHESSLGATVYHADHDLIARIRDLEFTNREVFTRWSNDCEEFLAGLLADTQRRTLIQRRLLNTTPELHDGDMASDPTMGASEAFSTWLRTQRERHVKAFELEASGLMTAAIKRVAPRRTLIIRGISDYGDARKSELDAIEHGALRRYAMHNATRLLWTLMEAGVLAKHDGR